jgi:hypothetical protein
LLDEGKITQREFEVVKTELLDAPVEEWAGPPIAVDEFPVEPESPPFQRDPNMGGRSTEVEPADPLSATSEAEAEPVPSPDPAWMVWAKQIPRLYLASLAVALLSVLLAGIFAPIAWVTVVVSIVALLRVKEQGARWMAWTALAVGVVFTIIGIFTSGSDASADARVVPDNSVESKASPELPVGALGLEFADLTERWNALTDPPLILKVISPTPEAGALDSFVYRFDEGALFAGAYNPSDGYVHAVMTQFGINHESRSGAFMHLCHLLHPGIQGCFDTFIEESGVYQKSAEELSEDGHLSSWMFMGNEWRVEVVNDVETIRVRDPLQTG